jgi:signal transduction histidine kinase
MRRPHSLPILLVLIGMVVSAALFATALAWLHPLAYGRPVAWSVPFAVNLAFLVVWAALVPVVVFFARRLPAGEGHWKKTIPAQLGLGLVMSITHLVLMELVIRVLHIRRPGGYGELDFLGTVGFSVAVNLQASMALYWTLTGLAYAREYYRGFQEQSLRASRQETQLTRARLQALEAQLAPHFLFNTLNSISSLVDHDASSARRMITRLGDLLRYSLQSRERIEVSLEEEWEATARYLEIERTRYADRLTVTSSISPEASCCAVPALMLQPLVENCVRHGVTRSLVPVRLFVSAAIVDDRLRIEVRDDGPGAELDRIRYGVGIANVQARLQHLYGDQQTLSIETSPGKGFAVRVGLPAHRAAVEEVA